jgi:maltose O-acetyltransferase
MPLDKTKQIGIEPPFYCDYGSNIKFKGEVCSVRLIAKGRP